MESNLFISSNKYEYSPMVNPHKVSLLNVIFQNLSSEVDIKLFFNQLNYSYDKVEGELGGRIVDFLVRNRPSLHLLK